MDWLYFLVGGVLTLLGVMVGASVSKMKDKEDTK